MAAVLLSPGGMVCVPGGMGIGEDICPGLDLGGPREVVRALRALHCGFPRRTAIHLPQPPVPPQGFLTESFSTCHSSSPSVRSYLSFSEGSQVKTGEGSAFLFLHLYAKFQLQLASLRGQAGFWMKG